MAGMVSELTLELRPYDRETAAHRHDFHQLVLPVSGVMEMSIDGRQGSVDEAGMALVAAGSEHAFASDGGNCFVVADVPEALAPELARLPAFIPLDTSLAQYVAFLHAQLRSGGSPVSERQMLLLLLQLLQERFGHRPRLDRRIDTVRDHLDRHFDQPVTRDQLSALAHLGQRQLNDLFRRELGMTPQQYLIEKRMQRAWQLLSETDLQVQQIAEQVGYSNLAAFSDRFRRHFGRSPRQFRRHGE